MCYVYCSMRRNPHVYKLGKYTLLKYAKYVHKMGKIKWTSTHIYPGVNAKVYGQHGEKLHLYTKEYGYSIILNVSFSFVSY